MDSVGSSFLKRVRSLKFSQPMRVFAVRLCGAMLLIGYAVMFVGVWPQVGTDWKEFFYPYSLAVLHGQNPYTLHHGIFIPWVLPLTLPFAILPEHLGVLLFFIFTVASFAFIAKRLGAKEIALVAFLFSPPIATQLWILNVDIFVFWGFILPPPLAMPLLLIKPQVGGVYAAYLAIEAWHSGGIRKLITTLLPTAFVVASSFLILGDWVSAQYSSASIAAQQFWNTSLFPLGLIAGLPLLVLALWKRRKRAATAAAVLCSPYVTLPSWGAALLACLPNDWLTVGVVVVMMLLRVTLWNHL